MRNRCVCAGSHLCRQSLVQAVTCAGSHLGKGQLWVAGVAVGKGQLWVAGVAGVASWLCSVAA